MTLCVMAGNAAAQDCITPHEAITLKTAVVQQQLMVAAFMCQDSGPYNQFVVTYRSELQRSDEDLKAYFIRTQGEHGEAAYDTYKTRAANRWALTQARTGAAFCQATNALFDAAFSHREALEEFVAEAPPMADAAGVC